LYEIILLIDVESCDGIRLGTYENVE